MPGTCVVGLQWGDEAKGKIVDLLTERHDFVVRFNGGANAGHTVVAGGKTFKFSLLPTGVLRPGVRSVIANGVVVDPEQFRKEVAGLRAAGVAVGANLVLSDHAHVIFPYHTEEERLSEGGSGKIGTTGRGIGPCYQDKVGRTCGVRVGELLHADHLRRRLRPIVERKNRVHQALAQVSGLTAKAFDADELCDQYLKFGEQLRPHITDTQRLLTQALRDGKRVLFEAAQGSLLDVDHGSYPYVTSSNSSVAGVWSGTGVPARQIDRIVGVVKAYGTRVGEGPFPTELSDDTGQRIRDAGREYGTVTGRPRRCGWFDAVAARYTTTLAGADELAVMLLDVLSQFDEVKVCTAYEMDGERIDWFPSDAFLLERCKPVYEALPGWGKDVSGARKLSELPANARRYVDRLGELLGVRVSVISVGPDREQTIQC
jgi:adenylosuccinate synthase